MFGTLDGQLAAGVEMDDLRHAVKRAAVLAQDVLALLRPRQLHVHEALTAPGDRRRQKRGDRKHVVSPRKLGLDTLFKPISRREAPLQTCFSALIGCQSAVLSSATHRTQETQIEL